MHAACDRPKHVCDMPGSVPVHLVQAGFRPANEVTLSSRRHEVLRGTADTGFSKSARRLRRRATTAAACLLLRLVRRPFPGRRASFGCLHADHPEATPARAALRSAPAHELYDLPSDICVCDHAYIFGARADRDVPELMSRTCHLRSARPTCSVVAAHPSNDLGRGKVANADSKRRGACRRVRN